MIGWPIALVVAGTILLLPGTFASTHSGNNAFIRIHTPPYSHKLKKETPGNDTPLKYQFDDASSSPGSTSVPEKPTPADTKQKFCSDIDGNVDWRYLSKPCKSIV